uniref:Copper chaperone PCu(A)C n=1 Tax=mine drainage metagenome TaxID=410659 RepID=E6PVJ4_9ZZZZ
MSSMPTPHHKSHGIARRALLASCVAVAAVTIAPAFAAGAPTVQAKGAWIRWLPANLPAGGYVQLSNTGDKPAVLVGAESPDYGNTMLHQTVSKGGVSEMIHVDKITIPAHGHMAFSPGGYHIMLMQPKKEVKPGDKVPITFQFEGGKTLTVDFEVRKPGASGPGSMKGMDMGGMKGMDMSGQHDMHGQH